VGAPLVALTTVAYRRRPPGPVPTGDTRGTLIAFPGTVLARPLAVLVRLAFWQGKVFWTGTLRNKITPLGVRAIDARVVVGASWVDDQPCILIDYTRTAFWPVRWVRDEIRLVAPGEYLGVIWVGRRRVGWFTLWQALNP